MHQDDLASNPTTGVTVRCKRCEKSFDCELPELSGAVDCPTCHKIAVLSVHDTERVRTAAADQLRDGSYNQRFKAQRSLHKRGLALLPETREEYARRANRLRRGAVHTCPDCLYNLAGVLDDESPMPCPECGEEVSLPGNTLVWGERAIVCRVNRSIAKYSGLVVGVWQLVTQGVRSLLGRRFWYSEFFDIAELLTLFALISLPIGVPFAAYEWLKRRNPTMNQALLVGVSVLTGIANAVVALLLVFIANMFVH